MPFLPIYRCFAFTAFLSFILSFFLLWFLYKRAIPSTIIDIFTNVFCFFCFYSFFSKVGNLTGQWYGSFCFCSLSVWLEGKSFSMIKILCVCVGVEKSEMNGFLLFPLKLNYFLSFTPFPHGRFVREGVCRKIFPEISYLWLK